MIKFNMLAAATFACAAPFALADGDYNETRVDITEIFAPVGFDDNDEVTLMIDGMFPNSCYKMSNTKVEFDQENRTYKITQFAKKFENALCLMVMVPYSKEISLGTLPQGKFIIEAGPNTSDVLEIDEATNAGPDDHDYAPIESVNIEPASDSGQRVAVLQGRFTNTCMKWDEIKLIDSGKTKQVLPIVKMEDRDNCQPCDTPFEKELILPEDESGRYLLHVRSLNGKAVNKIYTVY